MLEPARSHSERQIDADCHVACGNRLPDRRPDRRLPDDHLTETRDRAISHHAHLLQPHVEAVGIRDAADPKPAQSRGCFQLLRAAVADYSARRVGQWIDFWVWLD